MKTVPLTTTTPPLCAVSTKRASDSRRIARDQGTAWTAVLRYGLVLFVLGLILCVPSIAWSSFEGRPITTNAFSPTGYTLHKGEFSLGIGPVAFGATENVQIGTNILLWLLQIHNVDTKVSLVKNDDHAFAVGLSVYRMSLDLYEGDGEEHFTALAPFAAGSIRIGDSTMLHGGGQFAHFSAGGESDIEDASANESATGTSIFAGIEHSYSDRTKFLASVGHDSTFEGTRVGGAVLIGWTQFRLKLGLSHYSAGDGFVLPIIGMRWRFSG